MKLKIKKIRLDKVKSICDACMLFYNQAQEKEDEVYQIAYILKNYPILMTAVLDKEFDVPYKVARDIIENLGLGNWTHLWLTEAEEAEPMRKTLDDFLGEVFYCSDRWSWDRVLRVNWAHLRIKTAKLLEDKHNAAE